MEYLIVVFKIVIGLSLLNVWLIQYNKATRWRGGDAKTLRQEFEVYGLGSTLFYMVGFLKVGFALMLLASVYYTTLETYAALGLALLLLGSIIMHLKIKDPLYKSFPAALFLTLCLIVALS